MRIVNLAHGALYLFGGYITFSLIQITGSFFIGLVCAIVTLSLIGIGEQYLLKFARGIDLRQVLITLGLAVMIDDVALVMFGGETLNVPIPAMLRGAFQFGDINYPKYRLFVLLIGMLVFILLNITMNKTKLGALIRAGVDDRETIEALGVNISKIFLITFMIGMSLAALAGGLGGAFLSLYPTADAEILVFSLAIVIIGGRGSLLGAALGSVIVAMLSTFGQVWFPELSYFVIFGPMALLLAFRPNGLFGKPV
jgi:branched-chain amino acid transport system permease protein